MQPRAVFFRGPALEGWGIALAFATILALTLGGGLYLRTGLTAVRAEIPMVEAMKLREGFIALGDLHRLEQSIDDAARPEATTAERNALAAANDYLYLRADSLKRLGAEDAAEEVADGIPEIVTSLERIVVEADAALSGSAASLGSLGSRLRDQVAKTRIALVRYVDAQHQRQSAAIAQQKRSLQHMTIAAALLLGMFGILSGGTVMLLRAELRANRKRMAAEEQARMLAYFDPLTGLLNRTSFNERSGEILARHSGPALFLIDLDNFKITNDTHGHAAGDAVLRSVGEALDRLAHDARGIAARLGGDEFAVLVPGPLTPRRTSDLSKRLIGDIAKPLRSDRLVLFPRCSLGIYCADPESSEAPKLSEMLKSADLALYRAKAAGRGGWRLFDGALEAEIAERRALEEALPRALETGEFFLEYQPQIELSTGRLHGVEALVRWRRDGEIIAPAKFIPTAEETGLICDIDLVVLQAAARTLAGWIARGAPAPRVSVNLSSLHFRSDAIVEHVQDVLLETRVPAKLLTLELTETVLIENRSRATQIIDRLHALGVNVALDDFGTGYSGLGYLQDMQVDEIKIDRSFIHRLGTSDEAQLILGAVVGMAKGLGKTVVAEGIETENQRALVTSLGCDIGQGFYFARPQPVDAIEQWWSGAAGTTALSERTAS